MPAPFCRALAPPALPVLDDALDVFDSLGTDGGPNIEALQKTDVAEVFPE
jgi:hypothetical protein